MTTIQEASSSSQKLFEITIPDGSFFNFSPPGNALEVGGSRISRKRVLVAEGDDIVLALISHILTRQGYQVDVAATADEAEAQLNKHTYDALLVDTNLSGGGVEWMRRLKDYARRLIIIASGASEPDVPARALVRKPIEFDLLVETVANCVTPTD